LGCQVTWSWSVDQINNKPAHSAGRGQDSGCGTSRANGLARFSDGEKQLSVRTGTQQRRLFERYEDVQDVECRQT
jgi:hypothetical protein